MYRTLYSAVAVEFLIILNPMWLFATIFSPFGSEEKILNNGTIGCCCWGSLQNQTNAIGIHWIPLNKIDKRTNRKWATEDKDSENLQGKIDRIR